MEKTSTVIYLDYFEDLEKALPIIRKISAAKSRRIIIISSNYDNSQLSLIPNLKIIYFDELLSEEDYKFMDHYVFNLAESWHKVLSPLEGITEYKGTRYGFLAEEPAQRLFTTAIKRLEITLKIIECFHPEKIIFIGGLDVFKNLSEFVEERFNMVSLFIEIKDRHNYLTELLKKIRSGLVEFFTNIFDNFMRLAFIRQKKGGVFIDYRLYLDLKDKFKYLTKDIPLYLCLWGKGIHVRLRLFKKERILFAPLIVDRLLTFSTIFSPFQKYWKSISLNTQFQSNFRYKNLPIWIILKGNIRKLIVDIFSQTHRNVIFLQKIYKTLKPKVVVLREAARVIERTIVLSAQQSGIPTLVIQHGMLTARNIYTRLLPDKIAVWGRASIDWYARFGNDISKCIISGRANYDTVYFRKNNRKRESKEAIIRIGADPDKETILYIPAIFKTIRHLLSVYYTYDAEYMNLRALIKVSKCFPDKQMIIKLRRFEPLGIKDLRNLIPGDCTNIFIVRDHDTWPLIYHSALVITSRFSSLALDALLFDKPLITLNFYKRDDLVPFARRGVALSVNKPEDLCRIVKRIFEDEDLKNCFASNRESFIGDYAYKIDGKSTERIFNLIDNLIKNESTINKSSM